jgi:NhaP-type Na+/H+ or K+/H+ antiporter
LIINFNPLAFLYAFLSLTIIRMIPVAIGLLGTRLRSDTVLMMGWLGPRGLASIVFLIMPNEASHEAEVSTEFLLATVSWTILLSVLLHGISALPLANWYGKRMEKASPDSEELKEMRELRTMRRKPITIQLQKTNG